LGWLIFIDYLRYKNNDKPLFCFNKEYQYKDGYTTVCLGIFYKIVSYNRVSIIDNEFIPIWSKIKNPNLNSDYVLIDETEMCLSALEKVYEEGIYEYYLPCIQSDTIFLVYEDGTKISVGDALDNKIVEIDDLIAKGLKVYKEYKKD
jgi:hypothetical protein